MLWRSLSNLAIDLAVKKAHKGLYVLWKSRKAQLNIVVHLCRGAMAAGKE